MADQNQQQQRYPVAERNRRAKMKFLAGVKTFYESKRKASIESLTQNDPPKIDLSVPGTPISSRYLRSLSRRESECEESKPQQPVELPNEIVIGNMVIEKFLKDMKALGGEEESKEQEQQAEVVQLGDDGGNDNDDADDEADQVDTAQQYFKESEQKHAYHRSFSEAVQTLHSSEVKSPTVKRYFEESSAKHTYSRDFNEAVSELHPAEVLKDPLKEEPIAAIKGYKSSVPGTPISSKHLDKFRKKNYISDSSDEEDGKEVETNRLADPLNSFIKEMELLKAMKAANLAEIEKEPPVDEFSVNEYLATSASKKSYARTFSQAAQTLHSTDVKDPAIKDYFDQSEAKRTYRRDFSQAYQEIVREQPEPPKPVVVVEPEPVKQTKVEELAATRYESVEELFGKFEPPKLEKKTQQNEFCVDSYMTSSDAKKTYARSFSEAAQSLHSSDVKSPPVRAYFDQSEANQSFRRQFSEAYQEVKGVKEIARDVSAETSSDPRKSDNKQQKENSISRPTAVDGSTEEATYSKPTKMSISVPGTPINSRKLFPREKPPRASANPTKDDDSSTYYAKTELLLSPRLQGRKQFGLFNVEHYFAARLYRRAKSFTDDDNWNGDGPSDDKVFSLADQATDSTVKSAVAAATARIGGGGSIPARGRSVSAAENSMEKEFWKSFGASS